MLFTAGLVIGFFAFSPVVTVEINYAVKQSNQSSDPPPSLKPPNRDFSIIIPKINASAPVIANVDPNNSSEYQRALTQGVAHASGTGYPGEINNTFIFSHSSANLLEATRYNSIFYLLHKLEPGDEIILYYQDQEFLYTVEAKKKVSPQDITYLSKTAKEDTLNLMTCWPPGTTFQRLIVTAKPS